MKNYYVVICMDDVPILELLLNGKYKAIENFEKVDWSCLKYVVLNFKTTIETEETVQKGKVSYKNKILTKLITYYSVNLSNVYELLYGSRLEKLTKQENNIIILAGKLFFSESSEFLNYIKEKQILPNRDIQNFEKAFERIQAEKEMISSWKKAQKDK